MMPMWRLLIVTIFLGIAASDKIEFKGGDAKFKIWLDQLSEKIEIDPTTWKRVLTHVTKTITSITDEVKKIEPCLFTYLTLKGSASENLKVLQPDEFDYGLINDEWKDKIVMQETNKQPGFAYAIEKVKTCLDKFKVNNPPNAINPKAVRHHMAQRIQEALDNLQMGATVKEVGPAVNFEIPSGEPGFPLIDIDLTLGINQGKWPDSARDLPASLEEAGVALVPKPLEPPEDTEVWQLSFSAVETKLFVDIDKDGGIRKKVLKLAKYLKTATKWPSTVASYHLKTVLMMLNNDNKLKPEYWSEKEIVNRFRDIINGILTALRERKLPSFFVPTYNIFQDKPDLKPAVAAVENLIKIIFDDPYSLFPKKNYVSGISFAVSDNPITGVPYMIPVDMNKGSGGKYIYPVIEYSDLKDDAISGLAFIQNDAKVPDGYTKIQQDLNEGAGGTYNYLCITKLGENKMTAIDFLADYESRSDVTINGYFRYHADLNTGAEQVGYYVYLLYKTNTENAF